MERNVFSGLSRLKRILPGRKKEEFQLRYPLPNQEVYPSEIKQPSVDYLNSLFKQFFEIGLQLGEQASDKKTPERAYLMGQHTALEEILVIFTGKKEPTIRVEGLHGKIGICYEIDHGQLEPLEKWGVIDLLESYEEYYGGYLIMKNALELGKKYKKKYNNQHSFYEGAYSVLRGFLIEIGQGLPADEIQTGSKKSILGS